MSRTKKNCCFISDSSQNKNLLGNKYKIGYLLRIKNIFKPLHNRIGKHTLALIEFSLTFVPLKAIKGQIVVDFLANHSNIEILECYIGIKPWVLHFNGLKHVDALLEIYSFTTPILRWFSVESL